MKKDGKARVNHLLVSRYADFICAVLDNVTDEHREEVLYALELAEASVGNFPEAA